MVINPGTPPAYLAEQLENWSVDAAIVDAHLIADLRAMHPLLEGGMSVPISYNYAWTARAQNAGLLRAIDGFGAPSSRPTPIRSSRSAISTNRASLTSIRWRGCRPDPETWCGATPIPMTSTGV